MKLTEEKFNKAKAAMLSNMEALREIRDRGFELESTIAISGDSRTGEHLMALSKHSNDCVRALLRNSHDLMGLMDLIALG